jgi:hypothetical protein
MRTPRRGWTGTGDAAVIRGYSDSPIFSTTAAKEICDNLLTATLTIVEAGPGEINDSRHKLCY